MRSSWLCFVLLLFFGCASEPGVAQEREGDKPVEKADDEAPESQPTDEKPAGRNKQAKKAKKKKKLDARVYRATITDRHLKEGEKPFKVTRLVLFTPEVSLFGGSAGKESKTIVLRRGSASIEIPFASVEAIEVGKVVEDRLEVKLTVKAKKPEDRVESGTIKASLELRGLYASTEFKTSVKLRDVRKLTLELDPDAKENTRKGK